MRLRTVMSVLIGGRGRENPAPTKSLSPHRHDDSTTVVGATPLWCGEEMAESWTVVLVGRLAYHS